MKKIRIVTDISENYIDIIDEICNELGLTRSSYFRMVILSDVKERKENAVYNN